MSEVIEFIKAVSKTAEAVANRMDEIHAIQAHNVKPSEYARQKAAVYDHLVSVVKMASNLQQRALQLEKYLYLAEKVEGTIQARRTREEIITRFNQECRGPENGSATTPDVPF